MSSSEQSPFMTLPYEVLVKIFCYLEIKDLLKSTQLVSSKWKDLSHDLRVWKYRRCTATLRNEELIKFLRTVPSLQHLDLRNPVPDSILNCIPGHCRQLRVFKYNDCTEPSCDFLANLCSHCPRLEWLSLYIERDCVLEEIGKFPNLKHLQITTSRQLNWKPVADGCPSLISLDLMRARIEPADFAYLLNKKKHQLTALRYLSCLKQEECPLPYITVCKKLKELRLDCGYKCTTRRKVCLSLLRSMKTITVISLTLTFLADSGWSERINAGRHEVLELFKDRGMCQVEEIELGFFSDEVLCTVLQNCPLLKKVSLRCINLLIESSLRHLEALPFLESLDLSRTRLSGNVWQYLQNCTQLSSLNLSGCFKEGCLRSKQTLKELKNLRDLVLVECNLIEFPFHEVLSKFPKLEFLDLAHSRLSDVETVLSLSRQKRQLKVNLGGPVEMYQTTGDAHYL